MKLKLIIAIVTVILFLCPHLMKASDTSAELVLRGGAIYTMDAARSWAGTIAISGGRILYVGTDKGGKAFIGPSTKVIELGGKMVLPGFHDSHLHPVMGGTALSECRLSGLKVEEIDKAIASYAKENPKKEWIIGGGWNYPDFPGGFPRKEKLDALVPDRPALFYSADGHTIWVNSAALTIAGITRNTDDPKGGRIIRDAKGEPTGILCEEATDLVLLRVPETTREERIEGLRKALVIANGFGITSLFEASADEDLLAAYEALEKKGQLTAKITASVKIDTSDSAGQISRLKKLKARYHRRDLSIAGAKIFLDGVMESHTAALLKPYVDRPGDCGQLLVKTEIMADLVTELDAEGFQVHVHAIGDGAVHAALDAFEASLRKNGFNDRRHHVAHLQLIDPGDIPRFRELGAVANFQPLWAFDDTYNTEMAEPFLGPGRSRWLYPIGSVIRSGAVVVAGSDWNVSSMYPLDAMKVAVTRCASEKSSGAAWHPEEQVDLAEILPAYTINGAYLTHTEKDTGSLEPGKAADLVVLDRNIFTVKPHEINRARVLLTMKDGKIVFSK